MFSPRIALFVTLIAAALLPGCRGDSDVPEADAPAETQASDSASTGPDRAEADGSGRTPNVELPDEVPETLVVEDLREGDGEVVADHDAVRVDYVIVALSSGRTIDSSYEDAPVEFSLDRVIPGWSEGLLGMREGGRRRLVIPSDMAYGDEPPAGSGIEPGEALVFVVDLLEITLSYADKPTVDPPAEPATELLVEDIEIGDGVEVRAAEAGTTVTVQFVGVSHGSGEVFASSWDGGGPVTFDLDNVIPGWAEGLLGMREGGRRRLVIPPALAYGDDPPPDSPIASDDTLAFVIDLVEVG